MSQTLSKYVYSVLERTGKKAYWHRIGAVFVNKDGSETLVFDSYPTTIRVQLRAADKDDVAQDAIDSDK